MSSDILSVQEIVRATRLLRDASRIVRTSLRVLCINFFGLGFAAVSIAAQSLVPDDVLMFRKRAIDDAMPQGIRMGGLFVSPGIEVTETYDDNIFRTPSGEKSDFITSVKPALGIQSNWDRHAIFLEPKVTSGFIKIIPRKIMRITE